MGSPAGASSNMPGASASVYTPTAQPAADTKLQDFINSFPTATDSPAGQYYKDAQDWLKSFTSDLSSTQATDASQAALHFTQDTAFPQATADSAALDTAAASTLPYGQTALSYGFDPQFTTNVTAAENNPYYAPALSGAQQAADIGTAGASRLASSANQTLNTAYDPERALYNQGRTGALDYANVANSMSGLGGTPYGSSVTANTLSNYDLNWGDRQLGRQEKALPIADTALSDASKLAYTASGYPSKVYTGNLADITTALNARDTGASKGAATDSEILGATGTADKTAQTLDSNALKDYAYYGSLPYSTQVLEGKNALSGINDVVGLGNEAYTLPQQDINNLESYLKLGQSSSTISGNLGATGLNELTGAASGLGGLASTANNLSGGGITSALGGSGATSALGGASTLADFGAGGGVAAEAGTTALDAGVGAEALAAAAPAAAWIVCTELVHQGRMPRRYWAAGTRRFAAYSEWGKRGYYVWAVPAVLHLRQHPDSLLSKALATTFNWRAEHIAAKAGVAGARRLWRGAAVAGGLALLCGVLGFAKPRDWSVVYRDETA